MVGFLDYVISTEKKFQKNQYISNHGKSWKNLYSLFIFFDYESVDACFDIISTQHKHA